MTKFNMVEHHRERHCKNDKGDDPKIEIEMKGLEEVEKHESKPYLGIFANEKTILSMTLANWYIYYYGGEHQVAINMPNQRYEVSEVIHSRYTYRCVKLVTKSQN